MMIASLWGTREPLGFINNHDRHLVLVVKEIGHETDKLAPRLGPMKRRRDTPGV